MRRLVALLAALTMIGVAVWLRTQFIDSDGTGADPTVLRLRCGTDLENVCRHLGEQDPSIEVSIADEGATADALAEQGAAADFDAWLVVGPWAAIVADDRHQAGLDEPVLGDPSGVLARSPVTLVGPKDRMDALATHCGGTVNWTCLGDASGQPWSALGGQQAWGVLKAGLAAPSSGSGLVALDQAVASEAGRTDWGTADLDDMSAWFTALVADAHVDPDPLTVLLTRPGTVSVVAPLEQRSVPTLRSHAQGSPYSLLYPEPMVTADVTLVPAAGREAADVLDRVGHDRLARALSTAWWRVPDRQGTPADVGGPPMPSTSNLASPGALQALRNRWTQTR